MFAELTRVLDKLDKRLSSLEKRMKRFEILYYYMVIMWTVDRFIHWLS